MSIASSVSTHKFNDDLDWASVAASPPNSAAANRNIIPSNSSSRMIISDEFLEDFDDDDDAFFSSATGVATDDDPSMVDSRVDGVNKSASQSSVSSFGMVALTYSSDAAPSSTSMRGSRPRPTSPTFGQSADAGDSLAGDDISDDAELLDLDQRYLTHLRNPNSPHRTVARSCLVLHQLIYSVDHANGNHPSNVSVSSSSSQLPIQMESSSIYHIQRHQRLIHRILSSLTTCLSSHNSPPCRSLASSALATIARASHAKLRFDAQLTSVRLPPSIASRLEDECGNGAAYSLVVAAIEQGDDGVSSAALEALGRLTLDPHTDTLAAEVRGIAECANTTNTFMYENNSRSCWILEHSHAMRELQSKAWEHVVFPRMQHILHRISLYSSQHHLAKAIPVVSAAFVHALTQGHDTMPSRRALQTGKASHGKRGWREVDAEGLAKEYVEGILLPCFTDNGSFHLNQSEKALQRAIATACIRMSSASPHAPWRLSACRHATTVLLNQLVDMQQLYYGNRAPSSAHVSWKSPTQLEMTNSQKATPSPISSTVAPASVPMETLAGTAAMLVIALRGIPLHERAPGLTAVLRATLLFLPLGIPLSSGAGSLDLPVGSVQGDGQRNHYRLGRIGLLTEVALSVMLDGATSTNHIKVNEPGSEKNTKETITGTRSVLMQRILQSDQLATVWEGPKNKEDSHFQPMDELLWVFCSVATQVGNKRKQLFAKDTASVVEWSNLVLVMLDFFAGIICDPSRQSTSPFTDASHAAYNGLFAAVLKLCGSFPPSTLSISEHMLPNSFDAASVDKPSPVVGGPGKQLHHDVASALSKIATKILFLRDKSKHATAQMGGASIESSSNIIQLAALLVDAWLGRCIMNHDTKLSNDEQLDVGLMFPPLCHSEVEMLLQKHRAIADEVVLLQKHRAIIAVVAQLCRVLIASLEHVACMSELLAHAAGREPREGVAAPEKQVGPLAISMLNGIITSAKKRVSTDTEQGSMLRYQIALDANNAISRITECIRNIPQSYPEEDIVSAFHVSPLIANVYPKPPLSSREPIDHCAWFLYNHARLASTHRTDLAAKAVAPTTSSSGVLSSSKLIQPRNALRIPSAFSHSTIEMYQKVRDLPLLIPARPSSDGSCEAVSLTGSSDPISLILSHGTRRVRKGGLTEDTVLVVTMRLYNITPVPIRNGVRLDLKIVQEITPNRNESFDDGSTCVATSVYKHEIKGGDFVTWEVILGNWRVGSLSLQASVTFRELERESSTHKWVSGGEPEDDHAMPSEAMDDEDETMLDITLPCKPITISTIALLQPCQLVFFGGLSRCESNLGRGDTASFEFLWHSMERYERTLPFVVPNAQMEGNATRTLADTKKGYVILSSSTSDKDGSGNPSNLITGCAFVAPNGSRILCTHQVEGGDTHVLSVRSDSVNLLESLVGTLASQLLFLRFIFGADALLADESISKAPLGERPDLGHDFPSMTMRPNLGHDFPSMTMPARRSVLS
eukprot:CAMPEP_0201946952 /NCGR_PEP_ID=MMETSP0903-20130614/54685_1 /ASSEMBLY_ACC=CAM_ASM_000552 /TAXON_ID=420261 /ORGANISM="Thalassiosira antarctica, Strain CCMP982" /LENGTH=1484 /DNA_ID=CAMNT_0048490071 /DNA_START=99 /DNA_END=4553 /DNA_ORIENTATION=-